MTTNIVVVTDEQLGVLARRQADLFRRVREGTLPLPRVLDALQGTLEGNFDAAPKPSGRFMDCAAMPLIPAGWMIAHHRKGGQIEFDPARVVLYLDPRQQGGGQIVGDELRKALASKPIMNACALDHLLAHTALIPESWKQDVQGRTLYIYFWDTIYRDSFGFRYVRYLYWDDGQWSWGYDGLGDQFDALCPAALLAS